MNTVALYIGYIVIFLVAIALIGLSLLALLSMIVGCYRVIKCRQTFFLIRRYEVTNIYKASKVAIQFLSDKGISPEHTLREAQIMIENYRKRNDIKED